MEKYERSIGLKTLFLTIIKHFKMMFIIFVPVALLSFLITRVAITKTYQSKGVLSKNTVFSAAQYQSTVLSTKREDVLLTVINNLQDKGVKHSDGRDITSKEITNGLSFSDFTVTTVSVSVSFYFQSTDNTIVQPVLHEVLEASMQSLKEREDGREYTTLYISTDSTKATKNSKENRYFVVFLGGGAAFAFLFSLGYEIITDKIYDAGDARDLGADVIEVSCKLRKKM